MQITKIPASRTGIFVIICFSLLVIALFLIGNKQKLFSNTSTYYVKFREISGLKKGAQVTIAGISVGSVSSIDLPKRSNDSVLVSIHIIKEAQNLLHTDSKASVTTEGLVGDKTISITEGTPTTPVIPAEGFIIGQSPRDLMGVVDTAAAALEAVKSLTEEANEFVKDIRGGKGSLGKLLTDEGLYNQIRAIVTNTDRSITSITKSANEIGTSIDSALGNISATSSEFKQIASSLNNGKGSVGKLLNDTEFYGKLMGLSETIKSTVAELHDAMTKISTASGNTVEFTEALKHNFLVKGYFEDRGYWDEATFEKNLQSRIDSLQKIEARVDRKLRELKK
jgi:phospholipid/cholesterol/gamma-HCH transport system substrate-binding protein